MMDYLLVFRSFGKPDAVESFKYIQDLQLRTWARAVGFLAAILWSTEEGEIVFVAIVTVVGRGHFHLAAKDSLAIL